MKLHRRIAGFFGYELIKRRNLNDTLDQHLSNLLDLLQINCVIDVGANTGQFGRLLRRHGYSHRIVSFEPLASAFAELEQASADDDNWIVHELALGVEEKMAEINHCASSDFSSFREPNDYAKRRFRWRVELQKRELVRMTTLASAWTAAVEGITEPRVFLKLDTQGFDLEVLEGAGPATTSILGIQTEIALQPIYQDMPNYLDSLTAFHRRGFSITGLYPVSRDKTSLAVIEYDCVMRRDAPSA